MERFSDKENLPVILKLTVRTEKVKAPCYLAPPIKPRKNKNSLLKLTLISIAMAFFTGTGSFSGQKVLARSGETSKINTLYC